MSRLRRSVSSVAVLAGALGASVLLAGAAPAAASTTGPCTAVINGVDVTALSGTDPDDAIRVAPDGTLDVSVTSSQPIGHYEVQLGFAGFSWTVAEDDAAGTSWSKSVDVADYSRFGVGLYQVRVVSSGAAPCEGSVLIEITGSPFASAAGWMALAATGAGVATTALVATQRRARFPRSASALGTLGGLGAVLLAQQFGLAAPTRTVVLIGLGVGTALPGLAHQVSALVTKGRP